MREQTVESQIEFVDWLKKHHMYNLWASASQMQAMYDVWVVQEEKLEIATKVLTGISEEYNFRVSSNMVEANYVQIVLNARKALLEMGELQ